jgi:type VI secretion system protein ImpK
VSSRRGYLALALQETFTAIVRLRVNRQVAASADFFREHVKHLLANSEQDARRAGYSSEDVRLALYAVVVFLDESVLNSTQPMFADWPRRLLQDELFGGLTGGDAFYQHLRQILRREDSEDLADLLDVFVLCLQLGFRGRYSDSDGERHALVAHIGERILRLRGGMAPLSPDWEPPAERIGHPRDPWQPRLVKIAIGFGVTAVILMVAFSLHLGSSRDEAQRAVAGAVR